MTFEELSAGYNNKSLFNPFTFTLFSNFRLGIVGDNGIGKTTLIKTIMNELKPTNGSIIHHRELNIGYIKQNDYDLSKYENCFEYLRSKYPNKLDKELRGALGAFLFKKDEVFKSCSVLSHGEQMRLILCGLSLSSYDILILDEPTNHLDLVVKECLLDALKKYNGAIIFISHDRYFINELATYTLYLSRNLTHLVEGSYDDLKYELENKIVVEEIPKNLKIEAVKQSSGETSSKLSNNKKNSYMKRLEEIENRIADIDKELSLDIDYQKINDLTEEKEVLEIEYIEIAQILEN
jgi:ATP-binding cassette subfamily F protein 3